MNPRSLAIAAVLAIGGVVGAGTAVTLRSTLGDPVADATGTTNESTGAVPASSDRDDVDRPSSSRSDDDVLQPDSGADLVEQVHPEPFDPNDRATLRAHRQAVLAYLEAAHTFLPGDELGAPHHRATDTLHPDAVEHDAGVVVTSVPATGATHKAEVQSLQLTVDAGSRTIWTVTTRLVEVTRAGVETRVAGHSPITSRVLVTDWLEEPRVLAQTVDPDPVP